MATQRGATKPAQSQLSFRHLLTKRRQLEIFAAEDGHVTESGKVELTPVLREAVDWYIRGRNIFGREALLDRIAEGCRPSREGMDVLELVAFAGNTGS